jgi:hypothetical protein
MASKFRKLRFYPLNYGDRSKKLNLLEKRHKSSKEKTAKLLKDGPQSIFGGMMNCVSRKMDGQQV